MVLYDKTNPNLNAKADGPLNLSDEEQAEAIKTIENMRRSLDFFAQNGVDMITDFELPEHIESSGDTSTGFMGADRFINNYKKRLWQKSGCFGVQPEWRAHWTVPWR